MRHTGLLPPKYHGGFALFECAAKASQSPLSRTGQVSNVPVGSASQKHSVPTFMGLLVILVFLWFYNPCGKIVPNSFYSSFRYGASIFLLVAKGILGRIYHWDRDYMRLGLIFCQDVWVSCSSFRSAPPRKSDHGDLRNQGSDVHTHFICGWQGRSKYNPLIIPIQHIPSFPTNHHKGKGALGLQQGSAHLLLLSHGSSQNSVA